MTLLVLSCSKTKRATREFERVAFAQLYDGPMWRDVRASGFPLENVAAISAQYGFLEPDHPPIETYDRLMDDEISARICGTGCHIHRLANAIEKFGGAYVVGGQDYRRVVEYAARYRPRIASSINYAAGSFLGQRRLLCSWLRDVTGRVTP